MRTFIKPAKGALLTSLAYTVTAGCSILQAHEGHDHIDSPEKAKEATEKAISKDGSDVAVAPAPKLQKINETTYKLGKITIDTKKRTISFDAATEITDTLVEYALVNPEGKVHETLFITDVRPINLNIAFKLLGFKENKSLYRQFVNDIPTEAFQEATDEEKTQSYFTTTIHWTDEKTKKTHSLNINELIQNAQTEKTLASVKEGAKWSYGGSFMHNGKFAAELNRDLIAIFTDRGAVANFAGEGREDDTLWHPVTEKMPAFGTKVTIVITPEFPAKKNK
ncbi:MAG: YdjY domain-containing protein [Akkermansiaceae bacterium]